MKTFRILMAAVMILSVLLTACNGAKSDTIKVAILAPLSGSNPTFGVSTRDGALLAIKEWNARGACWAARSKQWSQIANVKPTQQ